MQPNPVLPKKDNICTVIIIHYPDKGFFDRFKAIVNQVGGIIIVDNRSDSSTISTLRSLASTNFKTGLILNDNNLGIAAALNQGCRRAKELGYQWVLTLDQDTSVKDDMVETLIHIYRNYNKNQKIAVIGSNFVNESSEKTWCNSLPINSLFVEKDFVITSGSLHSLTAFMAIGPFQEDFFIDEVDIEYCFRARSKGYQILMSTYPLIKQSIGNATAHHFLWRTMWTNNCPPLRWYYKIRNHILVIRMYALSEWKWTMMSSLSLLKELSKMCCFERDRGAKLKAIISGFKNGFAVTPAPFGERTR